MTERENIFIRILKRLGIITEFEVSKEDMCKQAQSIYWEKTYETNPDDRA